MLDSVPTQVFPPNAVTAQAPGKINPLLLVGPRRSDGYHELLTCFLAVNMTETVTVWPAEDFRVTIGGDAHPDEVPLDGSNLVMQTARRVGEVVGRLEPVAVHIDKKIPVGGGMAGGSADAAATLLALDELWQAQLPTDVLRSIAADIGSDVPFLLEGGACVGRGRGEILRPVKSSQLWWVVIPRPTPLSTPAMYHRLDELRANENVRLPEDVSEAFLEALYEGDAESLGLLLHNDMQRSALAALPALAHTLESGVQAGALGVLVSGSGPTVVWLARDRLHAEALSAGLAQRGMFSLVTSSPARGAHLVLN